MKIEKSILSGLMIFSLVWLTIGCGNDSKTNEVENEVNSSEEKMEQSNDLGEATSDHAEQKEQFLFPWVDRLNIRNQPNVQAKTIASVQSNETLIATGEKSVEPETIVLRGIAYHEPWYEVTTKDGTKGWVFGGAVKRQNEVKGNAAMTPTRFSFPVFGTYDLSQWTAIEAVDESGGDAETETKRYKKGNQVLEITDTEVGEYGYSQQYVLKDSRGTILMERNLEFSVDEGKFTLTESVIDRGNLPPKVYSRSQSLAKHYVLLNSKPLMVDGKWEISTLEE